MTDASMCFVVEIGDVVLDYCRIASLQRKTLRHEDHQRFPALLCWLATAPKLQKGRGTLPLHSPAATHGSSLLDCKRELHFSVRLVSGIQSGGKIGGINENYCNKRPNPT
jgi:hypothetical protein